ncbi:glycosyltransferase 87 family protein [Methylobacterium sp. 391_Methyba4]|uniref:glycosyltransferase 87 family protein n=1 Tax=Methylobacterium sp. 391_Methyba4 TaxID=3038924 RepID=UPI00241EC6CD|nr:glycosyltransferase 87 family protein [Methylobacterium sp. 391_Methyba4]WFS09648.1 glycosyltransferase 87 family protein [Methylobacterium sp. 391_Methyba4]
MTRLLASPMRRLAALGLALLSVNVGALAIHLPGADTVGSVTRANVFVGVVAVGLGLYLLAVRLVLRERLPRAALWTILGVAVLMRAALLPAPPFLSSDIYRYVWDGKVQAAGINPYRYIPADPALERLRDPAVYPLINRKDYARTIYPPAAQLVFAAVGRVSHGVTGMKLAMLGFEALGVLAMLAVLRDAGLPSARILIYAWNPLALWSFACDGHVDAVAIGLLGLALLARRRHRYGLAGALLGAATLVKLLPVVVAPAFVRGGRLWRPMLIGAAAIAVLYLPYLAAGRDMLGFAGGYGAEEGYDTGAGYWLIAGLGHLGLSPPDLLRTYLVCAGLTLAALALRIAFGQDRQSVPDAVALCRDAGILAALTTCAASPHYAWYYPWLALPAVVAPTPVIIWLGSAPIVFLIDPFNDRFLWPSLVFVPALVLAARALWQARTAPLDALPEGTAP